jgi:hypothetical protein
MVPLPIEAHSEDKHVGWVELTSTSRGPLYSNRCRDTSGTCEYVVAPNAHGLVPRSKPLQVSFALNARKALRCSIRMSGPMLTLVLLTRKLAPVPCVGPRHGTAPEGSQPVRTEWGTDYLTRRCDFQIEHQPSHSVGMFNGDMR